MTLTETKVTDRQKREFYLADSANYKRVVNDLPNDKKTDKFGNKLAESYLSTIMLLMRFLMKLSIILRTS